MKIDPPKAKVSRKDQLKKSSILTEKAKKNPEMLLPGNQRSNKMKRLEMKKAKKQSVRQGWFFTYFPFVSNCLVILLHLLSFVYYVERLGQTLAAGMEAAFCGLGSN